MGSIFDACVQYKIASTCFKQKVVGWLAPCPVLVCAGRSAACGHVFHSGLKPCVGQLCGYWSSSAVCLLVVCTVGTVMVQPCPAGAQQHLHGYCSVFLWVMLNRCRLGLLSMPPWLSSLARWCCLSHVCGKTVEVWLHTFIAVAACSSARQHILCSELSPVVIKSWDMTRAARHAHCHAALH